MSTAACIAAVHCADAALLPVVRRRLDAVARFYAPLRPDAAADVVWERGSSLVAQVTLLPGERAKPQGLAWGGSGPMRLDVGWTSERATLTTTASGPVALYAARGGGITAYATHAAAAALLTGATELATERVAELVAAGFVGGDATHIVGVRACPPATVVELAGGTYHERATADAAARWAPIPEREAYDAAEHALLADLERADAGGDAWLGLTAGMDSRVVAAAAAALGRGPRCFTWTGTAQPDVGGAADVAAPLGLAHRWLAVEPLAPGQGLAEVGRHARWTDGLAVPPLAGRPSWPREMTTYLNGAGGETGRAFYYRLEARNHRYVDEAVLRRNLALDRRLTGAEPEARRRVRAAVEEWIRVASACGARGWSVLDVVYGEQRLRRWGRSMVPLTSASVVGALAGPEVQRALASLPLEDRLSDGFHRRFLARHAPAVALPAPPGQRAGVPPTARRAVAAVRAWRRRATDSPRWPFSSAVWGRHPDVRTWLLDDVLRRSTFVDALGEAWLTRQRADFAAERADATDTALMLASVAALDDALVDVRKFLG